MREEFPTIFADVGPRNAVDRQMKATRAKHPVASRALHHDLLGQQKIMSELMVVNEQKPSISVGVADHARRVKPLIRRLQEVQDFILLVLIKL